MDKLVLSFFLLLSLVSLSVGIYVTKFVYSDKHSDIVHLKNKSVEVHLMNKLDRFFVAHKVLGPVMIGAGALGLVFSVMGLAKGMHYPSHGSKSNFGFKFY